MSSELEEPDGETIALIEKLGPAPQRDPQAAANGRAKFLSEARNHRASVSAAREQRRIRWKEDARRLARIPVTVLMIVVLGLAVVYMARSSGMVYISRSLVGNTSSTINHSLQGLSPPSAAPTAQPRTSMPSSQPAGGVPVSPGAAFQGHMAVKNADIRLSVEDMDRALDGVTQCVIHMQGYVITSRTWDQEYNGKNYKYATLTISVPVDQFESAMRRLRSLAVQVLDENISGQDVTIQYVDLQSQVTNLEATRDRILRSVDQAKTVEDMLRIDLEVVRVEAQIEQLKGRMNYLSNRSAFSTITINLEPQLPKTVPTPTPLQ